jgi:hypothetical protein
MKIKLLMTSLLAAAAVASTQAQTVQFTGYTNGAFGAVAPAQNPAQGAVTSPLAPGVTFYNSSFNKATAGGFASFGGNPTTTPGGTGAVGGNFNNFGSISLSNTLPTTTFNTQFQLLITFTAPPVAGGQNFTALVTGTVTGENGGVRFDFDNTPRLVTAANGTRFLLTVNDLSVDPGQTGAFSGDVQVLSVPEGGATVALLGMSLVGIAAVRRRLAKA